MARTRSLTVVGQRSDFHTDEPRTRSNSVQLQSGRLQRHRGWYVDNVLVLCPGLTSGSFVGRRQRPGHDGSYTLNGRASGAGGPTCCKRGRLLAQFVDDTRVELSVELILREQLLRCWHGKQWQTKAATRWNRFPCARHNANHQVVP